ncbi:hypothetical protein VKT23_008178 [Stygiomarasmius scandens]|uniref:CxC2-like cysteine cluster KDZ transposase-associated domain-containing protein n=1 Tax=Marasmiellus scandens TaxID=2682957 RepID=A0ABR1JNN2_9AGAR
MTEVRGGVGHVSMVTSTSAAGTTHQAVAKVASVVRVQEAASPTCSDLDEAPLQSGDLQSDEQKKKKRRSKKKRRRCEIERQYQQRFPEILDLLIKRSYHERVCKPCPCGCDNMLSLFLCCECIMSQPVCKKCFLVTHEEKLFFHWAYEWDMNQGYFVKKDLSVLGGVLDFCQRGEIGCSGDAGNQPVHLIVARPNGVHSMKARYCRCASALSRWHQLFKADMFPATLEFPVMAFDFECLRNFDITTKTSRKSAYDYCQAMQHITNNMFPGNISDVYDNFLIIARVWQTLMIHKWLGQGHGIDDQLEHRPKGNLVPLCPICPEPGVNMEEGWERCPDGLKHLHQSRKTLDGNFQANRFSKNADSDDISFFKGKLFFPSKDEVEEYERTVPQLQKFKHKADCGWIKAIARQDSKKFRGMDITGIINCQCDHVFVESTVNMKAGERFATTDLCVAKAEGLRPARPGQKQHDKVKSYDAMCAYCVNFKQRMKKYFPWLYKAVKFTRVCIPMVHVQNHADICLYIYASVYKPCVGCFIGKTAEMLWPELNQIGGATRQMTPGRREDVIIFHMTYWNFRKQNNTPRTLYTDLVTAIELYRDHRDHFLGTCEALGEEKVNEWNMMDRSPQIDPKNKKVFQSVYAFDQSKAPTLEQLKDTLKRSPEFKQCGVTEVAVSEIVTFLMEGIEIQEVQRLLRRKVVSVKSRKYIDKAAERAEKEKLEKERTKLGDRITTWREVQAKFMSKCWESVARSKPNSAENEKLYLPSDFHLQDH